MFTECHKLEAGGLRLIDIFGKNDGLLTHETFQCWIINFVIWGGVLNSGNSPVNGAISHEDCIEGGIRSLSAFIESLRSVSAKVAPLKASKKQHAQQAAQQVEKIYEQLTYHLELMCSLLSKLLASVKYSQAYLSGKQATLPSTSPSELGLFLESIKDSDFNRTRPRFHVIPVDCGHNGTMEDSDFRYIQSLLTRLA